MPALKGAEIPRAGVNWGTTFSKRIWTDRVCPACGLTLDQWLVDNDFTRHISCIGKPYRPDLQPKPSYAKRRTN